MKFPPLKILSFAAIVLTMCFSTASSFAGQDSNGHGYQHGQHHSHQHRCSRDLGEACSTKSAWKQAKRKNVVKALYEGLIYPSSKNVLADPTTASNLFEQSVIKGRVTPAGKYNDFEGAIEYFYGLALTPGSRVDAIEFRSLVASDDKVAVEVDLHFCQAPYTDCDASVAVGGGNNTIRQTGFYTFNSNHKIISFDLTILNLGKMSNASSDDERMNNIIGVCTMLTTAHFNVVTEEVVYEGTCTSEFDGVDDFPLGFPAADGEALTNCITFMSSIPYGTWDQPSSNTFTCRSLHSLLTPLRNVHCMHVNVDGGGKCVDSSYGEFFEAEF